MMKTLILTGCLFFTASFGVSAQEQTDTWSLERCLEYAKSNNITILKNANTLSATAENTLQAKSSKLPSLGFSSSQRVTNQPYADNNKTHYSGSYDLSASLTLFNGGKLNRDVKMSELNERIQRYSNEDDQNSISISIAQAYLTVLYSIESVNINAQNLEVSKSELERGRELKNVGSISKSDLAQLEAQYSSDQYQLVVAKNNLESKKMALRQLLQLDMNTDMLFDEVGITEEQVLKVITDKQTAFTNALNTQPEIKAMELNSKYSELSLKQAKAGYLPSLSLSAGLGTSTVSKNGSFGVQSKNNLSESLGVSINIPIFSNRSNKTAVNKAKIEQQTTELNNRQTYLNLQQDIESTWLDAHSSQEQYISANSNLEAISESYNLISAQFDLGMKNIVDLLTEKKNYYAAQTEVLQAKYMTVLYTMVLDFYQGTTMTL